MCLLIDHPSHVQFDEEDIADFFGHNPDGVGVMYAEKNPQTGIDTLYTKKVLPSTAKEAYAFYLENCVGRDCVLHFRLQTHGDIDLINCHPYFVQKEKHPIALMHNGILSTGNAADVTKSDTWHYIKDYLEPLLSEYPTLFMKEQFLELLEEHIGAGNKFVLLDAYGNKAIVNAAAFVEYKGAQLSNTYAWSSERGGYVNTRRRRSPWMDYFGFDDDTTTTSATASTSSNTPLKAVTEVPVPTAESDFIEDFFIVMQDLDPDLYALLPFMVPKKLFFSLGAQAAEEWLTQVDEGDYTLEVIVNDLVEFGGMSKIAADLYLSSFEDEEPEPSQEGKAA